MNWKSLTCFLLLTTLFAGCANTEKLQIPQGPNYLYMSDLRNIGVLDLSQQKVSIYKSSVFLQSMTYDKERKRIVAPGYSPEQKFAGLMLFEGGKSKQLDLEDEGFGPVHIYQHENLYVMDSARVQTEGPLQAKEIIIYDIDKNTTVKKFMIPGQIKAIAGSGTKVYVSAYYYPYFKELQGGYKSNIYEIDLETQNMRPIFPKDQLVVPFQIGLHNGQLYGVYNRVDNIPPDAPQNLFVKIDPKSGEVLQKVKLTDNARDLVFSADGNYAFVSHFYMLANQDVKIDNPVSRVDLQTFGVKKLEGDYRAAAILEHQGKIYLGSDLQPELTVLDESTLQVEKTLQVEMLPVYLANESKSGTGLY